MGKTSFFPQLYPKWFKTHKNTKGRKKEEEEKRNYVE